MQRFIFGSALILLALLTACGGGGGGSSATAEASVNFGAIQDCDIFIVLPNGQIDHYGATLEYVGSYVHSREPGENCAFGLLQSRDLLVLVENCISDGKLTQQPLVAFGLDGQLSDADLSEIDCAFNCPIIKFDSGKIPTTVYEIVAIPGSVSPDFLANTGEELNYFLRLDGFFDGDEQTEVTFGGDTEFKTFADGTATITGQVSANSYDRGHVPQDLIDSGAAGPFDLSLFLRPTTGSNPDYTYYEIVPVGRELVNINDVGDTVHLVTHPRDGSMPFQVGIGANEKNLEFGAAGWLNYEHLRFEEDGSLSIFGCLQEHLYSSDFLMNLIEPGSDDSVPVPGS